MPAAALEIAPTRRPLHRAFKAPERKGPTAPTKRRSAGVGLRYEHGFKDGGWRVWERDTGRLAWSWAGPWPEMAEEDTAEVCRVMNGMDPVTAGSLSEPIENVETK